MKDERCLLCGEGNLTSHIDKNTVEFNGVQDEINNHYVLCDACGADFAGPEQMRKNKRAMIAFKKMVLGRLSGSDVKRVREHLGLTQWEANKIFGGGPVAFSKYENDDVIQAESMDKLLRLISAHPDMLKHLSTPPMNHCPIWMTVPAAIVQNQQPSRVESRVRHDLHTEFEWRKIA